jgi:WD40 repeat protein
MPMKASESELLRERSDPRIRHMQSTDGYKYWAFISYSHTDRATALELHHRLERYPLPRTLVGERRWFGAIPQRLFPCFRDEAELSAAADLPERIREGLRQSRFLIVVCSPEAAQSKWVEQEILYFLSLNRRDKTLCAIASGEPYAETSTIEAIPAALRNQVTSAGELSTESAPEILAADLRANAADRKIAHLRLIASMIGVDYDVLHRREHRRFVQRLSIALGAACLAALILGALTLYAFRQRAIALEQEAVAVEQRNEAEKQARIAQSDKLVAMSEATGDLQLGLLLAAAAYRTDASSETRQGLFNRLVRVPPQLEAFLGKHNVHLFGDVRVDESGRVAVSSGDDGWIRLWNVAERRALQEPIHAMQRHLGGASPAPVATLSSDGQLLAYDSDTGVVVFDIARREQRTLDMRAAYLRFLDSGRRLLIVGDDEVWIIDTQQADAVIRRLEICCQRSSLAVDPGGTTLFSIDDEGTAMLWSLLTGKRLRRWPLIASAGNPVGAVFDPNGRYVAAAVDQWLWIVDTKSDASPERLDTGESITGIDSTARADRFVTITHEALKVWRWQEALPVSVAMFNNAPGEVFLGAALIGDTSGLVTMSHTGTRLWNLGKRGSATVEFGTNRDTLLDIAMDAERERVLVLRADESGRRRVERWELSTATQLDEQPLPVEASKAQMQLSSDGQLLIEDVGDDAISIRRRTDGSEVLRLAGRDYTIDDHSRWLFQPLEGSSELNVIDLSTGAAIRHALPETGEIYQLVASPSGDKVAIVSEGGLFVHERESGQTVLVEVDNDMGAFSGAVWSADGGRLAAEIEGKAVMVLAAADRQPIGPLIDTEHRSEEENLPLGGGASFLTGTRFDANPNYLWTLNRSGELVMWLIETGRPVLSYSIEMGEPFIAHLPTDVPRLVFGSFFGDVKLMDSDADSLHRKACAIVNRNMTCEEWKSYGDGGVYQATCDALPAACAN